MIQTKRVYEPPAESDGVRVLVDRLWPRGLSKERARVDLWLKPVAPSPALRKWFGHDPAKWDEFQRRYEAELAGKQDELTLLREKAAAGRLTLLYAAKDPEHNNAAALKAYLERRDA